MIELLKLSASRKLEEITITDFKLIHANAMQHRLAEHHYHIDNLLIEHIQHEVLPIAELTDNTSETEAIVNNSTLTDAECYGYWGDNKRL